MSFEAEVRLAA